jgi:hypothetical protein
MGVGGWSLSDHRVRSKLTDRQVTMMAGTSSARNPIQ